jgi:hypothetical protein
MRACTVSLNSRVNAILISPALSLPVVVPPLLRSRDIAILLLLGPAAEQDDDGFAILAEIHAVAGTEVDPGFKDASANAPFDPMLVHLECKVSHRQEGGRRSRPSTVTIRKSDWPRTSGDRVSKQSSRISEARKW